MNTTILIIAAGIGIHVAVVLLLVGKYFETRSRYVAWWTAGAAALAVRAGVEMSMLSAPPMLPLLLIRNALLLAGGGFFLTGSVARDPRARGVVLTGFLGFGGLVFAAVAVLLFGPGEIATAGLVTALAAGAAFFLAAEGYRRAEHVLDDSATRVVFAGLLAIGLNLIAWAWWPRTPGVIAASELLGGLSIGVFGTGIELRALQRARGLVILSQISAILQRNDRVENMLEDVLQRAGKLLQLHTGWVFLRNQKNGSYEFAAGYHLPVTIERDDRAALRGSCRCLDLLQSDKLPEPVNIVDCMRLERVGIRAQHASVPLRSSSGVVGLMNLVLPSGRLFSQRELALLATVGGEVGLAVEQTRLLDELQEKERLRSDLIKKLLTAYEDERRRIARELHDETGQTLTALILNVEMLRTLVEKNQSVSMDELDRLKELAEATLEEVRKLIYDLRPTILDDLGLAAALRWYVRHQVEPRGLAADLKFDIGDARLDPVVETAVFRIAQEALWNVVKHAAATRVDVALSLTDGHVHLRVKDNGRGFQNGRRGSGNPLAGGAGLGGMEERATLLGGVVCITSSPGAGTEIVAEIPFGTPTK